MKLSTIQVQQLPSQIDKLYEFLIYIAKDLGLPQLDEYDKARFLSLMSKEYPSFEVTDIKDMFERYVCGHLEGVKDHYGKWSANFFMSVAKAYYIQVWVKKPTGLLELPEKTKGPDKESILKEFEATIINAFDKYQDTGNIRYRDLGPIVGRHFRSKGILPELEITDEDLRVAHAMLYDPMNPPDRRTVKSKARSEAIRKSIVDLYDSLISEGRHIKDLL